jgi:hypothetical protein
MGNNYFLFEKFSNYQQTDSYKRQLKYEPFLLSELKDFLKRFPLSCLSNMKIDEYVSGANNKTSFCYYVEDKLKDLGAIAGRTTAYQKFVIYWNKKTSSYSFGDKRTMKRNGFGSTVEEIFKNVRMNLCNAIKASLDGNLDSFANNPLNSLFKNKVSYLYNHDSEIPIYSNNDLNIILSALGIPFDSSNDRIYKRKALYDFYVSSGMKEKCSPYIFMTFIYSDLGYRSLLRDENGQSIKFSVSKLKIVDVTFDSSIQKSKKDISSPFLVIGESEEVKRLVGKKGEDIVKEYLLAHSKELGIHNLIPWFEKDDTKGYDLSYFDNDGREILIEVKSTKHDYGEKINFEMSSNEFNTMKAHLDCYQVYFMRRRNNSVGISALTSAEFPF